MSRKRFAAKTVVSVAHHAAMTTVSTVALKAVVNPTEDSTEEAICEVGGFAIGTAIWWKTTDRVQSIVDVVADRRRNKKLENMVATAA